MLRFRRAAVALVVLVTLSPTLVFGQAPTKAGIVTTLEGRATATRVVLPQPVALTFKDDVFLNDEITTAEKSLARILLGGKAVVTVRERSSLTITEVPGRSTIDLPSGKIAISVARERMRPGEQIQIRTPNAITGIRGTSLIVDVVRSIEDIRQPDPNVLTRLGVFEGDVDVQHIHPVTKAPLAPPVNVAVNTKFTATGARPAAVGPFEPGDAQSFMAGLTPGAPQHVQAANEQQLAFQAQETADTLILTLLGGSGALVAPPVNISPPVTTTIDPKLNEQLVIETLTPSTPPGIVIDPALQPFADAPSVVLVPSGAGAITTSGNAVEVDASAPTTATLSIPLLTVADGDLTVAGHLLNVVGTLSSTTTSPVIGLDPTTVTTTGDLVRVGPGGTLTVAGTLVNDEGGTLMLRSQGARPSSLLRLDGGTLTGTGTDPLLRGAQSRITTSGDVVSLTRGSTLATPGTLLLATGGTLSPASGTVLGLSDGSSLTTGRVLDLTDMALALTGPVVSMTDGSSLTTTMGSAIRITGGSLTADSLIATDNSNAINVTGTVLDMTDTAVRLNLLGRLEEPVTFNRGANEPLIRMLRSTLTHLSEDAALLDFGNDSGSPFTLGGVGLVATGTDGPTPRRSVLDVNSLMALGGVNLTDTAPQIQVALTDVNANGVGSLIQVFGSPVTARGPLLAATGANFDLASSLLSLGSGSLTVNNPLPGDQPALLQFTDSNLSTAGAGLVIASSGNSSTLDRGLLDANNSTLVTRDGAVVALQGAASVTTTGTNAPLLRFAGTAVGSSRVTVDDNVVSLAALAPGGAAPSMSLSGPLLEATLTTLVNGDPATNPRSLLFVGDGATLASTSADPLVSLLDRTSLTTTGGMFSVRRSGGDPSTMTLAGSLLRAQDSSITAFATGLRDTAGAPRLCCNLLSVGQGAELTSTSSAPLIDLTSTTVSLGDRVVVVFDTTSLFGEPTITAPASVSLAGPLARAGGGSITGLEDFLGIFRSSLGSSTSEPLIQLDGTSVTMGGTSPISAASLSGRLLNISGSATTPATLTLAGPLFSASNSVITTTDHLFGVFGGARVTSTSAEPFLSITGGSATAAAIGSFFVMAAAAGVPPPIVSLEGGLLRARGTTLVNGDPALNAQAFMFVGDGASLSSTSPDALVDLGRSTVRTGALLSVRRPGATPSLIDLEGPFLIATDSSINTTATALRDNANQPILCCNVLSVGQGARFNSDSVEPFIDLARTRVITGDRLISVFDATSLAGEPPLPPARSFLTLDGPLVRSVGGGTSGISTVQDLVGIFRSSLTSTTPDPLIAVNGTALSLGGISPLDGSATAGRVLLMQGSPTLPAMLDLRGPLFNANNAVVTTTADGFSFFNGSHGISTTPNPLIAITGGSFTAGPNGTFLGLASNAGQPASSLSLQGPLLSATGTTLRNGNPGVNDVTFFFVGDGATLTSTTPQSLLAFHTTTVDSAANMLTLRRSTSPEDLSTVSLGGPLLTGTNSRFNTSAFSGFFVAEGARLLSTTSSPLISLVGSTFNAAPGEAGGFDFFSLTDTFGSEPALSASVALAGPFLEANGSQINARSNVLGVTRSSFTSTSTEPLLQLNNTTVNAGNSVTRVVDGQLLASTVSALASLINNSTVTSGSHAVDVTGATANVELRDLVRLTNSIMTVNNGHLVNLSASRLNVNGNLVTLAGNSTLNILNGLLLNLTGGNTSIEGALVRFTGANNTINVTNSIRPNFFRSGIPIFVAPGTPIPLVFGTPVVGTGAININGVPLSESPTGSLIAVQGGARLRIGRALPD